MGVSKFSGRPPRVVLNGRRRRESSRSHNPFEIELASSAAVTVAPGACVGKAISGEQSKGVQALATEHLMMVTQVGPRRSLIERQRSQQQIVSHGSG